MLFLYIKNCYVSTISYSLNLNGQTMPNLKYGLIIIANECLLKLVFNKIPRNYDDTGKMQKHCTNKWN